MPTKQSLAKRGPDGASGWPLSTEWVEGILNKLESKEIPKGKLLKGPLK